MAYPVIPEGETACAYDPAQKCLSDSQTGKLMADLSDALDEANLRLAWLHDWIAKASK